MIVTDQTSRPPARSARGRRLAVTLAIAICAATLGALVWLKSDPMGPQADRRAHAQADPDGAQPADPAASGEEDAEALPTEVKLASADVAKSLGLEFADVQSRALSATVSCNGHVAFNQNRFVELRARTDGIVRRIGFDVGAAVPEHGMLALIDSPHLGDLKAAFINAATELKQVEYDAARMEGLAKDQSVPRKDLRQAQTALAQQQTVTANAKQQLVNLGFTADEIASLVIDKETGTELPLAAPWTGTLVAREAVDGQFVERNARLFALADLDTMWVYLDLYESELGRVKLGQTISFAPDGLGGRRFTGKIDWINPQLDERTRITKARAPVHNDEGLLRANMFGRGQIVVEPEHQALVIPPAAVQQYRHRPIAFVRRSADTFDVRPVVIGIKQPDDWEIVSGLSAGDEVVTTGSFLLYSELEKDKLGPAE